MRTSRRGALGLGLGGIAFAATSQAFAQPIGRAFILSTWDFGAAANAAAHARWQATRNLVDAVEAGARVPEADPSNHSVGYGGYPDREGRVTLDAIIMDDRGNVGAVGALEDIMHPISVARRVMEQTPHTMLVGEGARQFALDQGFKPTKLLTPEAEAEWRTWLKTSKYHPIANSENQRGSALDHDTIGIVSCDPAGRLAGACTTSGMAFKMRGRLGDSPQAGSGLFVEAGVGAATATGVGEEVTRIAGTARVVASMRAGMSPQAACREAVVHIARLRGDAVNDVQVGFLAVNTHGVMGAFALQPGFTFAATDIDGKTILHAAQSLKTAGGDN